MASAAPQTKTLEIEVDGIEQPFRFEITQADFREMRRESRRDQDMAVANFIKRICKSHTGPELVAQFDAMWALPDLLMEKILPELGYMAGATVKKP